jgi:hypothetical protein
MSDIWVGAIASLLGVIVGTIGTSIATYLSQERLWERTTRRELYGSFVGGSYVCLDRLLDVAHSIREKLPKDKEYSARWEQANTQVAETSALAAQIAMVAGDETRDAADALIDYLSGLKSTLYHKDRDPNEGPPKSGREYQDEYSKTRDHFTAAASRELGIARSSSRRHNLAKRGV